MKLISSLSIHIHGVVGCALAIVLLSCSGFAGAPATPPPLAPEIPVEKIAADSVRIMSVTPASPIVGRYQKIVVRVNYALKSLPKGVLMLGFNTNRSKAFNMIGRTPILVGGGVAEISADVAPVEWRDGTKFTVFVNLSPDPQPQKWTPVATDRMVLVLTENLLGK